MKETLLHTPEGVRDIYNSECEAREYTVNQIHNVLRLHGNHDIETPTFELFDIFNHDRGSAHSNEMYKFFDRNNNTLVLRPDMTPSVARCIAKYFSETTLPIRLCYKGNTFINAPQHQGKLNESTQIGCELINDDSSAADAEMIACVVDCLKATGLTEFQIEIGEIEFFKGLIDEAGVSNDIEEKIRDYIQIKNFFGLSEYVSGLDIQDEIKKIFDNLDTLFGGPEMLDKAEKLIKNELSLSALSRMKKVYAALSYYGYESYVTFDLSMINGYDYYTGIVFSGYTYGTGNPIVKGGRYNHLLAQFGKDAPSIGFAIQVDDIMNAKNRQNIKDTPKNKTALVIYTIDHQDSAIRLSIKLRSSGVATELIRKSKNHKEVEYMNYAENEEISRIYMLLDSETVRIIDSDGCVDEERNLKDLEAAL